jgi:hypothetical protein
MNIDDLANIRVLLAKGTFSVTADDTKVISQLVDKIDAMLEEFKQKQSQANEQTEPEIVPEPTPSKKK